MLAWGPRAVPWRRLFDAAQVRRAAEDVGLVQRPLEGKHLALLAPPSWADRACGLREAAAGLGLRVSPLRADEACAGGPANLAETMRLLGRLYDAVACDGMSAAVVQALQRHAGLPVLDGWSADDHPSRLLAELTGLQQASGRALHELVLGLRDDEPARGSQPWRAAARALGLRCVALAPARRAAPNTAVATWDAGAGGAFASGAFASSRPVARSASVPGSHAVDAILDLRDGAPGTLTLPRGALSAAARAAHRRWAWQACLLEALA